MKATITPARLFGSVSAPPSKSMAHRYIICAALSGGTSRIDNIAYSEDVKATLSCVEALGAVVTRGENYLEISGMNPSDAKPTKALYVNESGSTLRFLIPIALLSGSKTEFYGKKRLFERPLGAYEKIAGELGFEFSRGEDGLTVCGRLKSGKYEISENKSSQFISGLLFALPLLTGDSTIELSSHPESKPYIDMTISAMRDFGVKVTFDGDRVFKISGNQKYSPQSVTVEGDYSNAAFFDALNLLGSNVTVSSLREDTVQGDAVYREYYDRIRKGSPVLDITDCPDIAPILMTLLADCGGGRLVGTRRLKFKESDRGEVMRRELSKLGANILCLENEIIVEGTTLHPPKEPIDSNGDHRVVMSAAVLLTKYGGEILGCEDCKKSMPDFFERLSVLGAVVKFS